MIGYGEWLYLKLLCLITGHEDAVFVHIEVLPDVVGHFNCLLYLEGIDGGVAGKAPEFDEGANYAAVDPDSGLVIGVIGPPGLIGAFLPSKWYPAHPYRHRERVEST